MYMHSHITSYKPLLTSCIYIGKFWKFHPYLKRKYFEYFPDPRAPDGYLLDVVDLTTQVRWTACVVEDPDVAGHFFYYKNLVA
jgi:hypothetical protein